MTRLYRFNRESPYLNSIVYCQRCAELEAENARLRSELRSEKMIARLFNKAILADYEWRGFPEAENYLIELFIEQVKREADDV